MYVVMVSEKENDSFSGWLEPELGLIMIKIDYNRLHVFV